MHGQQETARSSLLPPSLGCQASTGWDMAMSIWVDLEASNALPSSNKGCVGEGATHERRRSDGEPEEDGRRSSAAATPFR